MGCIDSKIYECQHKVEKCEEHIDTVDMSMVSDKTYIVRYMCANTPVEDIRLTICDVDEISASSLCKYCAAKKIKDTA